jgi:hypothetical protein
MAEQNFLNEGGIIVTNARFVVSGQTYAMSGVTSLKSLRREPSRKGPLVFWGLGILLLFAPNGIVGGLICIAIGAAWWAIVKPEFVVVLNSASGEAEALTSKDSTFISRVVTALNEAIVHRG